MLAYTIGDLTKAWKATEIEFYMQAPTNLQAPIISNLGMQETQHKIEYIVSKATKFQLEKYSFVKRFLLTKEDEIFYHKLFSCENFQG